MAVVKKGVAEQVEAREWDSRRVMIGNAIGQGHGRGHGHGYSRGHEELLICGSFNIGSGVLLVRLFGLIR